MAGVIGRVRHHHRVSETLLLLPVRRLRSLRSMNGGRKREREHLRDFFNCIPSRQCDRGRRGALRSGCVLVLGARLWLFTVRDSALNCTVQLGCKTTAGAGATAYCWPAAASPRCCCAKRRVRARVEINGSESGGLREGREASVAGDIARLSSTFVEQRRRRRGETHSSARLLIKMIVVKKLVVLLHVMKRLQNSHVLLQILASLRHAALISFSISANNNSSLLRFRVSSSALQRRQLSAVVTEVFVTHKNIILTNADRARRVDGSGSGSAALFFRNIGKTMMQHPLLPCFWIQ